MRVIFVVVVDPGRELLQDGRSIRARLDARVVAFQGRQECLADAVALRTSDWRETGHEGQSGGEVQPFVGGVGLVVVGEPLHGMGRPESPRRDFSSPLLLHRGGTMLRGV
jgi:hypothetical protein